MNPKTKKIIIIVAVVLVAIVLWAVLLRKAPKGTAEGYIDRLNTTAANRRAIKGYLQQAALEQDIAANATANGINQEQALALTAAYYLVNNGTVDDATWQLWKQQIKAMG